MPDLRDFIRDNTSDMDSFRAKKEVIEEADKQLSSSDVRRKEVEIFQPKDVLTFMKWEDVNKYFDSVKLYFSHREYYLLFHKYFKISEYIEANTYHIEPIVALLVALERGDLKIETEDNTITLTAAKPFELKVQNG